jgi:hypothetical protein
MYQSDIERTGIAWETLIIYFNNIMEAYLITYNDYNTVINNVINKYSNRYPIIKNFIHDKYKNFVNENTRRLVISSEIISPMPVCQLINDAPDTKDYKIIFMKKGLEIQLSNIISKNVSKHFARIKLYDKKIFTKYTYDNTYCIWQYSQKDIPGDVKFIWLVPNKNMIPSKTDSDIYITNDPSDFTEKLFDVLNTSNLSIKNYEDLIIYLKYNTANQEVTHILDDACRKNSCREKPISRRKKNK